MKYAVSLSVFLLSIFLTGCSGFFAAMGPVEEDPGRRTKGARVEDESIETKSHRRLDNLGENYQDANIHVDSFNGFVLITGQVPNEEMKVKASEVIKTIRGVRRIYNELAISGNTSALTRSGDAYLTTKVKSKLVAAEDIQGGRVSVITEDGVVYLMGLVSHAEAERIVDVVRATGGVEKVVQIFEWID